MTPVALQRCSFLVENKSTRIHNKGDYKMKTYKGMLTAVLLTLVLTISVWAQNNSIKEAIDNKYALKNLVAGIHSENDGVRRSSIYLAGYYRIIEAEDALIDQLTDEKNASTRILISLVLFELGSEKGMQEVKNVSVNDGNAKVRRMATQIYNEYIVNNSQSTAYTGNR